MNGPDGSLRGLGSGACWAPRQLPGSRGHYQLPRHLSRPFACLSAELSQDLISFCVLAESQGGGGRGGVCVSPEDLEEEEERGRLLGQPEVSSPAVWGRRRNSSFSCIEIAPDKKHMCLCWGPRPPFPKDLGHHPPTAVWPSLCIRYQGFTPNSTTSISGDG